MVDNIAYDTGMQKYIGSQKESYSRGFLIRMQMPDRTFQKSWLSINHIRKCFCSPAKKYKEKKMQMGVVDYERRHHADLYFIPCQQKLLSIITVLTHIQV